MKKGFNSEWDSDNSKLLSVIAINGFIFALLRQLKVNGLKEYGYYEKVFKDWDYSFSKEDFGYTSSQYRKFSSVILRDAFHISEEQLEEI